MYLIDTSVLIDFLKAKESIETKKLENILQNQIPFGISAFTYQETLQGAKDEKEYKKLNIYLSTQKIYYPKCDTYETAATAMENTLILLHSDRDFDYIADIVDLKVK